VQGWSATRPPRKTSPICWCCEWSSDGQMVYRNSIWGIRSSNVKALSWVYSGKGRGQLDPWAEGMREKIHTNVRIWAFAHIYIYIYIYILIYILMVWTPICFYTFGTWLPSHVIKNWTFIWIEKAVLFTSKGPFSLFVSHHCFPCSCVGCLVNLIQL
jgi:hypothetical protein